MTVKKLFSVILTIALSGVIFLTVSNCKKNSDDTTENPPTVTTASVTDIGQTTANGGGNVTSDGGATVTARGVCYSTSSTPTITDLHTTDGTGTGSFTSNLTGLTANTPYYFRAYATNSAGTAYGNQVTFTTSGTGALPTVTTVAVTNISKTSAIGGGNVTSDGGATVTSRGVCYITSSNPTIADRHTTDGTGTGSFTSSINGLTANTHYYVRAYATNSTGTAYGNQVAFTSSGGGPSGEPCPGIPTITDPRDGQVYPTVQIGSQCWLQKNMNYQTGNSRYYDANNTNCNTYGMLYDWETALGVCPSGWHLPSDAEWTALTDFLGGLSVAGGKMKETGNTNWHSPNTGATNESGFTALPGGYHNGSGYFGGIGYYAYFLSSTEHSSSFAWLRYLSNDNNDVGRGDSHKTYEFSVRCVRD